ncbi:MAG: NAD(P)/FAD-dependent oxidoreductase [Bacteroidales bacterium]|nr:NAD(P)/FAD-dependent oxidoreductase [Bacteroidales bacterium]MDD2280125.1 NAD(P)/FAD-dependent oxidoreductase [Bacteroidales bacterium]MDD4293045.1 NAD(P)/FAD-dependent oxidoreductase [Bacteroidales bacterium]MDD4491483.1 NAD(P)/FAD-dependent oxidoreductase [Bacteroidales bacterium]HNW48188.1 NAD(P)/FAD-dependent oxidoreductase [Bacteroidales bacterium]
MENRELIVIGAGAAGMLAALSAAEEGVSVLLLEKMEKAGRKVRITGKGRCNITNTKNWDEFSKHVYPKNNFFKPAFYNLTNSKTIALFEKIGLETIIERGDRVYPKTGQAKDVVDSLVNRLNVLGVEVRYNARVTDVKSIDGSVTELVWDENGTRKSVSPKAVIVATGGLSYPTTGSDGDGYKFAGNLGHNIVPCFPSLTALMPKGYDSSLESLVLKNVTLKLYIGKDAVQEEFGDIEFTNNGLEGPLGLRVSRKAVKALLNGEKVFITIDLKPALSEVQLINRINREFDANGKIRITDLLPRLLPKQLIEPFMKQNKLLSGKILSSQLPGEIYPIIDSLKNWKLEIESFTSFERCVITAGGVSMNDIVSKNMSSRIIKNLYFAGEVIDIDGDTGGYNLQIAFSTGYLAGKSAAHFILKSNCKSSE